MTVLVIGFMLSVIKSLKEKLLSYGGPWEKNFSYGGPWSFVSLEVLNVKKFGNHCIDEVSDHQSDYSSLSGNMNVCTKSFTNPCCKCWDVSQNKWKLQPDGGATERVRGSPTLHRIYPLGTMNACMYVNVMANQMVYLVFIIYSWTAVCNEYSMRPNPSITSCPHRVFLEGLAKWFYKWVTFAY